MGVCAVSLWVIKIADVGCAGSAAVGSVLGENPLAGFLHNKSQSRISWRLGNTYPMRDPFGLMPLEA